MPAIKMNKTIIGIALAASPARHDIGVIDVNTLI
jgi:hypothetical protein